MSLMRARARVNVDARWSMFPLLACTGLGER